MISSIEGVKKIDLPINMISNLGEIKSARVSNNVINGMKKYYEENTRLISSNKKDEYRDKVTTLYNKLDKIKPIDATIDNVVYLNNYFEKGIAIEPNIDEVKQIWTEYRLIYNDHNKKEEAKMENEKKDEEIDLSDSYLLSNFDQIYDELSKKINGVGNYIDEIKQKKQNIDMSLSNLEDEKYEFEKEKMNFNEYKEQEEQKIEEEKKKIKEQLEKIDSLVKIFDLKISDILK